MRYMLFICTALMAQSAWASITVQGAYARPSRGPNSAIFMTIQNDATADVLVGADVGTDICQYTELHTHIQEGDVFKMRKVDSLAIPAKGILELKRGGDHIMLMQLSQPPLEEGQTVSVTLHFKHNPDMVIDVPVENRTPPQS